VGEAAPVMLQKKYHNNKQIQILWIFVSPKRLVFTLNVEKQSVNKQQPVCQN